jgi:hypothetical protein
VALTVKVVVPFPWQRVVGPDGPDTGPTFGVTVTVVEAVVAVPQPLATTVTVADPLNVDDQVTTPDELIVPAAAGEILQE